MEGGHEVVGVQLRLQPDGGSRRISHAPSGNGVRSFPHKHGALAEDVQRIELPVPEAAGHVIRQLVVPSPTSRRVS